MLSCHLVVINSTCVYVHSSPTDARSYTFIYIERKQSTTTLGFHICLCPVQAGAAALIFSLSCFPFLPSTLHFFQLQQSFYTSAHSYLAVVCPQDEGLLLRPTPYDASQVERGAFAQKNFSRTEDCRVGI